MSAKTGERRSQRPFAPPALQHYSILGAGENTDRRLFGIIERKSLGIKVDRQRVKVRSRFCGPKLRGADGVCVV